MSVRDSVLRVYPLMKSEVMSQMYCSTDSKFIFAFVGFFLGFYPEFDSTFRCFPAAFKCLFVCSCAVR